MSANSDAFRQKLFRAAGMAYTKPQQENVTAESIGTTTFDGSGPLNGTIESSPGSPARRPSVSAPLEGMIRRVTIDRQQGQFSPALQNMTTGSRRSSVLADLESASSLSLGATNFFSRQKAVKEALVQSIIRRKERNQGNSNSLFLFPSIRNQATTVSSTSDALLNEVNLSNDELGESISDFIKLGVHVSSSWLQDELRISPTAKKRFEIFRNPTPEFPDDPTTPKSDVLAGSLKHAFTTEDGNESIARPVNDDNSDIKLFDIQFSATEVLKKQGISVDGSQTMLQKIIWNHDECLLNLQHLSLSSRDLTALSAWLLNLPPTTRLFLKFRNCGLTDRSFDLLFDSLVQKVSLIQALDLSDNKLTSRSTSKVLTLLETCKKCQQWELCGLHLQDSFAEALAKSNIQEAIYFLSKLDLSNNSFGNFGMCSLVPIISTFPHLEFLDLSCARITSKAASRISTCFCDFQKLSHLELNNCCLSDEDANLIVCSSIKCKTLTEIKLRDNQIVLMPILSLCAHLSHAVESNRTSLKVIDFSSNPLDFIAYERLMDMKEDLLGKCETESTNIMCNDCNWSHNIFSSLNKDVVSLAYGNGKSFNVNCKMVQMTCDSSKHVWQCFLLVLQWRQCHSLLPICKSDYNFTSKQGLFEVFLVPKDAVIQITCRECGFWDIIGHESSNLKASAHVQKWILEILKSISFHDFGVPEAVILPVIKNIIFRYDMFNETEIWKRLLAFSGSHDGRLGILLPALAKQISCPDFKDKLLSLPKSITADVFQKFSSVLLHSGNSYSGRSYICFDQHLHRLSFKLLHSFNRSVRIQRINQLSLDLSDDCSVNIVRTVQDETGNCTDFERFVDSEGNVISTKSFVTFDTSLPTCAEGNTSDEFETAELIVQLKNWAKSVYSLGIDAINSLAFARLTNTIEFYDIRGGLEMVVAARGRNYRCEQIVLMLQALDGGLIHRIPDDEPTNRSAEIWSRHPVLKALFLIRTGGFRASFLHLMWDSIIDKESVADIIAPVIKSWEWYGVIKRVGSLLLFNPLSAQGSWKLHLDKRDDRMVADMIIQLKIKEKGHMLPASPRKESSSQQYSDKIDENHFDVRSIGSGDLLPKFGTLVIHLQSIDATEVDLELRHKLAQKCAIKEWLNTDIWFRDMQAKRK